MRLEELLKVCNHHELGELYTFWNGDGGRVPAGGHLISAVADRMTDEVLVRRRLRFLSSKLVDLLRYFLGRRQFEASLDSIRRSRSFSFMSPHEVEAAVRALVKRGFLFPRRRTSAHPSRFVVAGELADLLRSELKDLDLDLSEAFSLERLLMAERAEQSSQSSQGSGNGAATPAPAVGPTVAALCASSAVQARVAELPEDIRRVFHEAVHVGGGLLPRSVLMRAENGLGEFDRRRIKQSLEEARLGTVRHLALGEYGINHFDDTVIVFEEVLAAILRSEVPQSHSERRTERSLGVDVLSDLSQLLGRLSREKVRLTQNGTVYRTAARKIEEELILSAKGVFDAERLFEFLLDLALRRHLTRRTADRFLALTGKGRTWPRLSVAFKLGELLKALLEDCGHHFHRPRLRNLAVEQVRGLEVDRWYDFGLLVGWVRHHYLATLDDSGVRDAYQSRYQYSSEAHMRDLLQLSAIIGGFLGTDLHLLGLVDVALEGERPVAFKLTSLACKALGLGVESEEPQQGTRLLVNPDFEVLVFPDGDAYELIQCLDRFAERMAGEGAFRYRITPRSVERAVAAGMSSAEILEVLSENSETELPQNVVYSIRDYAEKVRFVQIRRAVLLAARHKEVIDGLLRQREVRKAVLERLSPRLLALHPDANLEELIPRLEEQGVFLDGDSGRVDYGEESAPPASGAADPAADADGDSEKDGG